MTFEASRRAIDHAIALMPDGVGSDFRRAPSPTPLVLTGASGPYVFDVDGNRLIDYYLGMGPMILGHSPEPVVKAVERQLRIGILYAGQSDLEYAAARLICDMVPCAERVRFGSSGSEVVQAALRIARAATGRSKIIKFEGHYHGWFDNILWSVSPSLEEVGPREAPRAVPGSEGLEDGANRNVVVLPWNDLPLLEVALASDDVAAVIMEPAMCNTSAVAPSSGYLEGVRAACDRHGSVLVFDEVITGFRLAPGGAQELFGVIPDLAVFGKAIASGFPVSAIAGRADLMDLMTGASRVMQAGTYNGGAVMMAATIASLEELRHEGTLRTLNEIGSRLKEGIESRLTGRGIPAVVQGWPTIFHVALGTRGPIVDYRTARESDAGAYVAFTTTLLRFGVRALERGAWFVSAAHDDQAIDETLDAIDAALEVLALQPSDSWGVPLGTR
jgi:glutamate-1-semialdehyde 2,1-aminomutase